MVGCYINSWELNDNWTRLSLTAPWVTCSNFGQFQFSNRETWRYPGFTHYFPIRKKILKRDWRGQNPNWWCGNIPLINLQLFLPKLELILRKNWCISSPSRCFVDRKLTQRPLSQFGTEISIFREETKFWNKTHLEKSSASVARENSVMFPGRVVSADFARDVVENSA